MMHIVLSYINGSASSFHMPVANLERDTLVEQSQSTRYKISNYMQHY